MPTKVIPIAPTSWNLQEETMGALKCTGVVTRGGQICLHLPMSAVRHQEGMIDVLPSDGSEKKLRNQIAVFEAQVHTAKELFDSSGAIVKMMDKFHITADMLDQGAGNIGDQALDLLVQAYESQHGAKNKKVAKDDPRMTRFARRCLMATQCNRAQLRVYMICVPEANCEIAAEIGKDVQYGRRASSVMLIAQLEYDPNNNVDESMLPLVNWNNVLYEMMMENRARIEAMSSNAREAPTVIVYEKSQYHDFVDGFVDGEAYTDKVAIPAMGARLRCVKEWGTPAFRDLFSTASGIHDPNVGPWRPAVLNYSKAYCVSEVMGLLNELRRESVNRSVPAMFPRMLNDESLYYGHLYRNSDGSEMHILQRQDMDAMSESPVYTKGIDFTAMYAMGAVLRRCVIQISECDLRGRRWLTSKPSLGWWWSERLPWLQTRFMPVQSVYRPSVWGLSTAALDSMVDGADPLRLDELPTEPIVVVEDPNRKDIDAKCPVHQMRACKKVIAPQVAKSTAYLRSGGLKREDYVPMHVYQTQALEEFMHVLPTNTRVNEPTKVTGEKLAEPGFLFGRETSNEVPPVPLGPDYEGSCNMNQTIANLLEAMGVCNLHGLAQLMLLAILDSTYPHKELGIHLLCYGLAEVGKSYLVKLLIELLVPGTIAVRMLESARASTSSNEKSATQGAMVFHETPAGITVDAKASPDSNVAVDVMKNAMTEKEVVASNLAMVEDGDRIRKEIRRTEMRVMIILSNLAGLYCIVPTFLSRVWSYMVPAAVRPGHSVADSQAWGDMHKGTGVDQASTRIKDILRTTQCLTSLFGNMIWFGLLAPPDCTAFALVRKRIEEDLCTQGQQLRTRAVGHANRIALTLMYQRIVHDMRFRAHAPWDMAITPKDIFDQHQTVAMSMSISEAEASKALVMAMATFNEDDVRLFAATIRKMLLESAKTGKGYAAHFTAPPVPIHGNSKANKDQPPPEFLVDLRTIRMYVGRTDSAFVNWCGGLCKIMRTLTSCQISPTQMREIVDMIADVHGPWRSTVHKKIDMMIPAMEGVPFGLADAVTWTVEGKLRDARVRQMGSGPTVEDITRAGKEWAKGVHAAQCDRDPSLLEPWDPARYFFAYETGDDSSIEETVNVDKSQLSETGYISISVAFLDRQCDVKPGDSTPVVRTACTSNTVTRPLISVISPNPSKHGEMVPYLCPSDMMRCKSDVQHIIPNPSYAGEDGEGGKDRGSLWSRNGCAGAVPDDRKQAEVAIPMHVPLDVHITFIRARELAQKHPTMIASLHLVVFASASTFTAILAPGLLHSMYNSDSSTVFKTLYDEPWSLDRDARMETEVRREIDYSFRDFVRPCGYDAHGDPVPLEDTPRANELHCRYRDAWAHRVRVLANSSGMGRIRDNSLRVANPDTIRAEIAMIQAAKSGQRTAFNFDVCGQDMPEIDRLRCLSAAALATKLKEAHRRLDMASKCVSESRRFTSARYEFTSYLDEYTHMIKTGEISDYSIYSNFVRYSRAEAKKLLHEQSVRESAWRGW